MRDFEINEIENLAKGLRAMAKEKFDVLNGLYDMIDALNFAAGQLEKLSEKLQAANMERSEIYYGDQKQRILTINIQIGKDESKSDIMQLLSEIIDETNDKGYGVMNATVDGIEIFDYKGFSKEFFNSEE